MYIHFQMQAYLKLDTYTLHKYNKIPKPIANYNYNKIRI